MAVVHNHAPAVVPFSCTSRAALKPIFHMSAFIGLGVPNWDIRDAQKGSDMLVRTPKLGQSLAQPEKDAPERRFLAWKGAAPEQHRTR